MDTCHDRYYHEHQDLVGELIDIEDQLDWFTIQEEDIPFKPIELQEDSHA